MTRIFFVAALGVQILHSQVVLDRPLLRIEAGMHTARIWRIAVDDDERFLVTGSDDATVRVWELPTGRLLRAIRPPVGSGDEGKVFAVAISPDGKTIAAGGWTGYEWDRSTSIYVFDRESGVLRRRIVGLPDVIRRLQYSPDGRLLAAALGGANGVRLFDTAGYSLNGSDTTYGSESYGAAFSTDSRQLIATSFDGFIRLYDVAAGMRLLRKEKAPGGGRPYGIAFSPDGTRVVLGYDDAPRVDVLAAGDLSLLFSRTVPSGELSEVAWSRDGSYLYAGSTYWANGSFCILRWNRDGGEGRQFNAARNTIVDLIQLRDGRLVFGSTEPGFGILDQDGSRVLWRGPPGADFRNAPLYTSADGLRVGFGYELWGRSPAVFSTSDRLLSPGELPPSVAGPLTTGLNVTDWLNSTSPKLDGTPLKLKQYETSRSLAIVSDQQSLVLGTDWYLRLFDRRGNQRWEVPAPSTVRAVNIPRDGHTVIAAFNDGTIRWYRIEDGKELLAFFPAADRKRWVLWSPSGYFDASPGGEDLIGWHVNNGHEAAADFYPASRFRSTYYRPDIISRVLRTLDEGEALRFANAEIGRRTREDSIAKLVPPIVSVLSPADHAGVGSREVTIRYELRTPSGEPVTLVRALVDGRPAGAPRRLLTESAPSGGREVRVSIPDRDCEVSIIAENRYTASQPAIVHLLWRGVQQSATQSTLYLLAIGISTYPEKFKLQWASKDAQDFATVMQRQKGVLYRDVQIKLLRDQGATREAILDGLEWVEKNTTENDVGMLFLSGHGWNDSSGIYYFIPVNFDVNRLRQTAVPSAEVQKTVQTMAGKVVVFLDTCYSGNVLGGRSGELRGDINGVANELVSAENGAVVFTASSGRQVALERPEWGNGAFTKALMEGLGGKADMLGKGKITINGLDYYISERVKELTENQQTPTTAKPQTIADFPIAVRR